MKHILYLLSIVLLCSYAACSDSDTIDVAWKNANDKAYQETAADTINFKELKTKSGPSGIYYKIIESGDRQEAVSPFQTSKVKVLYKGAYHDGNVFDLGTSLTGTPAEFSVDGTVRGFSFALQNMVAGDKWEIWIPYWLGYGYTGYISSTTGETLIKGYSTLIFEVELVEITLYP
jgi:FKBP-type peptidyl-prolyl cis-trans isomerase